MDKKPALRRQTWVALLPLVRPLETPLIAGASALLWVACVTLNNHVLFEWTELTEFRHLVFVPAGAKIVLIMALGARAALGIWLGSLTFVVSDIPTLSAVQALGLTLAYAGVPLMVITSFSRAAGFARPWVGLGAWHLALIVLAVSIATSVAFNGLLAAWGIVAAEEVLETSIAMVVGDVLGAGILLITVLAARSALRRFRR
jgi:hypothetical protein